MSTSTAPRETTRDRRAEEARGGRAAADGRAESRTKTTLYVLAGALTLLVFAAPLLWAMLRAFQPNAVITAAPSWSTFLDLTTANFAGLEGRGLLPAVGNSLLVSLSTAALTAVIATAAGYGFGRFTFRLSTPAFGAILLTMMVPFQAILTPLFLQLNAMRLTDSLLGLVLFYTTVNLPFGVFVMRNSFATVPADLEDAAFVDGAGTSRTFFSVLRPLVAPGIATTALYAFLVSWTEFLGALTFLTRQELYTLPVALLNLQQGAYGQVDYGLLAAGALIAMVPCVVLYVALQRFYVAGLASGAVKG
ncbi:carbohydrate ABC transporter permease [Pseudokineococcus marinus]|uniref:Carbohydrate ABC transporter permease n=1 Tax=Pseudokineococcus marinus TaxID=351215 RepID=A0A849BUL8_9ACTN|nr:carbohydrate ABC transporter permease [Pseudokineococcus marinus]NNH23196.1 carbohydrate ABC transporter permease [Pseudokineococcus marinus]